MKMKSCGYLVGLGALMSALPVSAANLNVPGMDLHLYGDIHVSADIRDTDGAPDESASFNSNKTAIGIKGNKELEGTGLTGIFKVEFEVEPDERNRASDGTNSTVDRDQWVGVKGRYGKVMVGSMSSNYKQMGGKVDPLYKSQLEGRGFLNIQSNLHSGAGEARGRSTNTIQYTSPQLIDGLTAVVNTTMNSASREVTGVGVRYKTDMFKVYVDALDVPVVVGGVNDNETAVKVGGSVNVDIVTVGAQYEATEDLVGADYWFLSGDIALMDDCSVLFTVGEADGLTDATSNTSWALAYNHSLGKSARAYLGYGEKDIDGANPDASHITLGMQLKF